MTTSLRFCLSYDWLKWDFNALKVDIISVENITLSRTVHGVPASYQMLCNVWSYDFYDMMLTAE